MYSVVDGVAVIPVIGSLVNRGAYLGDNAGSGLQSYEGTAVQVMAAAEDPQVRSILLDMESPGGETAGFFGLFDVIRAAGEKKATKAFINDMAASAAYGLASATHEIVISRGSVTGSVGVVMMHLDHSEALRKKGIKPTFIYSGSKKVDGNPLEPLSENVRADLQHEVDMIYDQFVKSVAAGRGLTQKAVRATEAGIFRGAEAIDAGFADKIGTFTETVARLSSATPKAVGGPTMTTREELRTYSQAEMDQASAAARDEGRREGTMGIPAAVGSASARIRAILSHEEAAGREAVAQRLAFDTDMTAEAAVDILKATPKAAAAKVPPVAERGPAPLPVEPVKTEKDGAGAWAGIYDKLNAARGVKPHPVA